MRRLASVVIAVAMLSVCAATADAKPKLKVIGWTTQAGTTAPQVRNKQTINQCLDMGTGQRTLDVIFGGKGIKKDAKVGVGVWGGPVDAGYSEKPTNAAIMQTAFAWPVGPTENFQTAFGYGIPAGPFGPTNIDGAWHAKILVKGKQVAKGRVTVACG